MGVVHIILLEFKPTLHLSQVNGVCAGILSLKEKCLHPETGKPYIKSSVGGRDMSPEGLQGGFTHAFVSEFDSQWDRDYYLEKDPAHQELKAEIKKAVQNIRVLDFVPGQL